MPRVLMLAGVVGFAAATAALWLHSKQRIERRWFAVLITLAVTSSLFSLVTWAATAFVRTAPVLLTAAPVGTLGVIFALRLYRELHLPPDSEPR